MSKLLDLKVLLYKGDIRDRTRGVAGVMARYEQLGDIYRDRPGGSPGVMARCEQG